MKYELRYKETYSRDYEVEANSLDEAKARLITDISAGKENPPEECTDSSCEEIILTEAVEVCPWCESENIYPNWDVEMQGYVAICQHCGKEIFLCDECRHADDNPKGKCDWRGGDKVGKCFRGVTLN